jgi:hypothetical protein
VRRGWAGRNAGFLLLNLIIAGVLAVSWKAVPATASEGAVEGSGSWVSRNLERYFGGGKQQPEDLQGRARRVVDAYLPYEGRLIEVVLVHQVASFSEGWNRGQPASQRLLTGFTGSIQSYTRDSVIRQYLLFESGDQLDPYLLADSEILLRRLPYINDVRLVVVPLAEADGAVAVVVETTDKWPFGVDARIVKADEFRLTFFSENLAGTGVGFSNQLLHKAGDRRPWGYRGLLYKDNLLGRFLRTEILFEDSYRRRSRALALDRALVHNGLRLIGGLAAERTDDFTKPDIPHNFNRQDVWLGTVHALRGHGGYAGPSRSLLIPALRYQRWQYLGRPQVEPEVYREFHNRRAFLAGMVFQRLKNYKTSYLFGDGETEDLRIGLVAKLSGGYEVREFQKRAVFHLETGYLSGRARGQFWVAGADYGGYLRNGHLEEGVLNLNVGATTKLFDAGRIRYRFFGQLGYTLGLNRYPGDRIFLNDRTGVRDLDDNRVAGNQRLVATGETRLFTDRALLGFRFSFLLFADAGLMGCEDSSSLLKEKVYVSSGVGIRLRNPSLVLPTIQLQASLLSNVDDSGVALLVKVTDVAPPPLLLPGNRPSVPVYE